MSDIKTNHTIPSSQEHDVRVEKVAAMRAAGIEPWPQYKEVTATLAEIKKNFQDDKSRSTMR